MPAPGHIRREVEALSGVRIVGAAWVALFHLRPQLTRAFPDLERLVDPVLRAGYLGVSTHRRRGFPYGSTRSAGCLSEPVVPCGPGPHDEIEWSLSEISCDLTSGGPHPRPA